MSKFTDFFFRTKETQQPDLCLFSEKAETVDYFKDDRSNPITYSGIGKTKYGSGIPPATYDSAISAVKSYPVVYGAISARSEAIGGLGIKIFDVKGDQEAEVKDHDIYTVFRSPNPYQGTFEFLEQIVQFLDVTGNAFIAIEPPTPGTKQKFEMYVLPTKYVAIVPDSKIKVKEYRFYVNGQTVSYKPEEIIHIKYSDVDDPYYGMTPLTPATEVLTFEGYRIQFASQYFKNGAIPAGVLETDATLSDPMLKKLRGDWNSIHGGIANSHKIAILMGGLKYKAMTSPIKDLDLTNLKRLSRDDILMLFKMPAAILGDLSDTSGEEGRQALKAFWNTSLIPLVRRIESSLNRGLRDVYLKGGKQVLRFNLKAVEALSDDKESQASYVATLLGASVITSNEGRAYLGLPPSSDPNADKLMVSNSFFGQQMIPAETAAAAGSPTALNQEQPTAKPNKDPKAKPAAKPAATKPPKKPTS